MEAGGSGDTGAAFDLERTADSARVDLRHDLPGRRPHQR